MPRYVALLRGINVGKAKRIAMADLRSLFEELGHEDVSTLLVSGNVVFTSGQRNEAPLARAIERAIDERLKMDVKVFVRSVAKVRAVVDANPFPDEATQDPTRLLVTFFDGDPDRAALAPVLDQDWSPEAVAARKGVLYVWYPGGMTGSKLGDALAKATGPVGTARNFATLTKLLARASSA